MTMSERGTVHGIMYCVRDREICHLPHVHVQRDCAVCVPVCISTVKPFFFVARDESSFFWRKWFINLRKSQRHPQSTEH